MLQRTRIFSDDYFVVTKRRRRLREWSWEIQRRSKPLGIRLNGDGFKSEFAAKLAGEKAAFGRPRPRGQGLTSQKLRAARMSYRLPYGHPNAANKTSGLHKLLHCVGASGESTLRACWNQPFPSRPYSLRRSSASLFSSP